VDLKIIDVVAYLVVFWIVGQVVLGILDARKKFTEQERNELMTKLDSMIHMVNVEKHGDVDYWFDNDSGQFLGQGATFNEVVDHIKSRFPEHVFLFGKEGGLAAETGWKLLPPSELKKLVISKQF
jgi:hypothetical protein